MSKLATASIKTFGPSPKADFETIELSVSEFQNILKDSIDLYNLHVEIAKDSGIVRGKELAKMTTKAQESLKAARSPCEKLLLINAYAKQLLARIRTALKTANPTRREVIRQAITKIQLRAEAIVTHIKTLAEGKEKVSLSSPQARQYLAGMEGKPISRRDCIRALHRAEKICPVLVYGHTPGDRRATTRIIADTRDLLSVSIGNDLPGGYNWGYKAF